MSILDCRTRATSFVFFEKKGSKPIPMAMNKEKMSVNTPHSGAINHEIVDKISMMISPAWTLTRFEVACIFHRVWPGLRPQ